jgi:hypothetical protein
MESPGVPPIGTDREQQARRDSRVVAFYLSEHYLWQFPPGSQCDTDDEEGDIVRGPRY